MWPRIGPIPSYGALYLTGIIVHFLVGRRIAARSGLRSSVWVAAGLCYLLGMTCGAKILFIVREPSLTVSDLLEARIWAQGGMWGGLLAYFVLAVPTVLMLARDKRAGLDLVAVTIPIPWMLAKMGCFLNGCCHGRPTTLPWAVTFPESVCGAPAGIPVHPTQLYEIGIMAILLPLFGKLRSDRWRGTKLLWFLCLYGLARAATDFLRGDTQTYLLKPLTLTQLICLATAGIALAVLVLIGRKAPGQRLPGLPLADKSPHRHVCPSGIGYLLASPIRKIFQNPSQILRPYIQPDMKVLDFGCAMGFFSLPMARAVRPTGKVVCVDLQANMLDVLRKRAAKAHLADRIETHQCDQDAIGLQQQDVTFDFALVFAALHETPDQARILGELYKLLRSGASLLLAEPKGHVTAQAFEKVTGIAEKIGFTVVTQPDIHLMRAVLLAKSAQESGPVQRQL